MGREALAISRSIALLENLRGGHVAGGPEDKSERESGRLLGLAGDVARDEREDEITFG